MSPNDRELMYRVQPEIVKEWHLSSGTYVFYVSMFFLGYALVTLPQGIYADRVDEAGVAGSRSRGTCSY